jgi:death on curing protein
MYFPTEKTVLDIHAGILEVSGGLKGLKNPGLLESAIRKAVVTVGGEDAYPTLFSKAAAIGVSITQNHVFNDANKRTGLLTMLFVLRSNGYKVNPSEDAASTLMILIATTQLNIKGVTIALLHWAGENPDDA